MSLLLRLVTLACLLGATACGPIAAGIVLATQGGGGGGGGGAAGGSTGPNPNVGPQGGTLSGGGARLTFPANAVSTSITVSLAGGSSVALAEFVGVGPAVQLGPAGTQFAVPVTLELSFDPSKLAPGEEVVVLKRNDSSGAVQVLTPTQVDRAAGTATVSLTSFSTVQCATRAVVDVVNSTLSSDNTQASQNTEVTLTVRVVNAVNQPIPGLVARFELQGQGTLTQPSAPTDSSGTAQGKFVSSVVGANTITARVGPSALLLNAQVVVTVSAPQPPPPPPAKKTFAADVHALALQSCAGCHDSGTGGYTASQDEDLSFSSASRELVLTPGLEENSLILRKASRSGNTTHGGGTVWDQGSAPYNTVLAWIRDGALQTSAQPPTREVFTAITGVQGIAVAANDDVYAAHDPAGGTATEAARIRRVTSNGATVTEVGASIADTNTLVVDVAGRLVSAGHVLVGAGSSIYEVDPTLGTTTERFNGGALTDVAEMAFAADGRLFAGTLGPSLAVVTSAGASVYHSFTGKQSGSVCVDEARAKLYVGLRSGELYELGLVTPGTPRLIATLPNTTYDLAYTPVGAFKDRLFACSGTAVYEINVTSGVFRVFQSGFVVPLSLAFDSQGRLLVSDRNMGTADTIYRLR